MLFNMGIYTKKSTWNFYWLSPLAMKGNFADFVSLYTISNKPLGASEMTSAFTQCGFRESYYDY